MRSTLADDYQDVPRLVAVMAKDFPPGAATGRHTHPRAQLLYATAGLMVATTEGGTWAVPTGHALLIPPGVMHDVAMHGAVSMRTAYLAPEALTAAPPACRVLRVSPLLDATLVALAGEPTLYDLAGRGGHLAALVLDEIARAPDTPFALPLPRDPRLRRLCRALIDDPGLDGGIDAWAEDVGMSRRTLTRRFRTETGLSFGAWRRRVRLLAALTRQAQGGALHEVTAAVGYSSPRAFRAMVQRTMRATTPSS
ncbi:helix-turn-helix transcriptional regulator [Azospirillum sp. TSO22-1]|uniref:AraC family transcriptional regulator n=1 Tax=Azospirillum sp. TSO22-1 TaxID=716789 RepID=UPI000D6049D6|nr:helix-turn-helix transcriptional regulator [Azospirillum sp. TSO22-1]PWC41911.1 AraC family transcriptional regulator [Azospirillum sp. TSO22-1]